MKSNIKNNICWIILVVLIIIFYSLAVNICSGNISVFDSNIYNMVENIRSETLTFILKVITDFGGTANLCFIALITVIILFIFKKRQFAISVILNLIISSSSYVILKNIFRRPRPPMEQRIIEETGFSFPSGHATNNVAFYGFAIYLVFKYINNKVLRNILCILMGLLALAISFSRVYLRVHYPSDVIAGMCLGIGLVIIFVNIILKKIRDK